MRFRRSVLGFWGPLVLGLSSGIQAHAAVTGNFPSIHLPVVTVVAETQAIARRQGLVNVNGIGWNCSASNCRASVVPGALASHIVACQLLAREVGAMRVFSIAGAPMNSKEMQQCNSAVPAAAPESAATPAPPRAFSPIALRTPQLTVTGVGVAELTYRFTPVSVRAPLLTITGVGLAETVYRFTPVAVHTPQLTVTGTGVSE